MKRSLQTTLLLLVLSLAAGSAAWADRDAAILSDKQASALLLEDGTLVRVGPNTRIEDAEGGKLTFAEIMTPAQSKPAPVRIEWEGSISGNTVDADLVIVSRQFE